MNKFVLLILGLLSLSGIAAGYQINIDAPATLSIGRPLVVTGTTNFGIGTPIDVVLYHQLTTNTEVKRKIAYVQSDRTFRVVFDTTNLRKGTYKVEVPASGLGESINTRIVELIDRTDEISLTTLRQEYSGYLHIAGALKNNRNAGVQIEVTDPLGERIFGPQYIATNTQGSFSTVVPITLSGDYDVSFTDSDGYVGTKTITVFSDATVVITQTILQTPATSVPRPSAHARSSRDSPVYFEVKTGSTRVDVYTSSQIDWVMEYVDDKGILHTVNDHGELNPEEIAVQGKGGSIFFKVYPYKYSDSGEVFLYAENAQSVRVSPTVPAVFGSATAGTALPGSTQSPVHPAMACLALLTGFLLIRSNK